MLEIVFLGTGSAVPTRFRNLSATAIIRQGEIFLFDCGEGTQIQLRKAHLRPGRLTHIFISHFHGDHIFGLPGLLTSLQMAGCKQDIHLYGPEGIKEYVQFMQRLSKFTLHYPLHIVEVANDSPDEEFRKPGYRLVCKPLQHRMRCLGWALIEDERPGRFDSAAADRLGIPFGPERGRLQQGQSIRLPDGRTITPEQVVGPPRRGHHVAYCLDTIPTPNSVELARHADLLIHDATFSADSSDWASETGHSTVTQAADIAKQAGVRQLALTHISGRFMRRDDERLLKEAQAVFKNTILAQDLMRIRIEYEDG